MKQAETSNCITIMAQNVSLPSVQDKAMIRLEKNYWAYAQGPMSQNLQEISNLMQHECLVTFVLQHQF